MRTLVERAGRVDVLVANAGLPAAGDLGDFTPDEIDRALDVNLRAPLQLTRALVEPMVERGRGHVVLVSSTSGKVALGGSSIYATTKFGVRAFGFAVGEELRGTGVGITTVFPGFIRDAGMFAESGAKLPRGTPTRTPQQVAAAVVRGIEKGPAEIDVAPLRFRLGGWLFGFAPGLVAALSRAGGGRKVADALAEGQRDKR